MRASRSAFSAVGLLVIMLTLLLWSYEEDGIETALPVFLQKDF